MSRKKKHITSKNTINKQKRKKKQDLQINTEEKLRKKKATETRRKIVQKRAKNINGLRGGKKKEKRSKCSKNGHAQKSALNFLVGGKTELTSN